MKNENLVPKVRFKGFSDPWEQRKLGDITAITMGQSPSSANYTNNPEDHILVQGNADMKNGYVLPRVWTTQITKKAEAGDLILSVRAPVGDIGKTDYDVVLGRGVASIKGNEFIYQTLKYMNDIGKWTRFSTGSTFESINSADIKDARIGYPKLNEQNLIGNILEKMDSIIAANEDKLEQLKTLKKLMMQKIFSQEWRFKGYTDPWEQRKFSELFFKSKLKNNSLFSSDKIISVATMTWKKPDASRSSDDYMKTYNIAKMGDIVFEGHTTKEFANGRFVENTLGDGIVSHIFDVYSPVMKLDLFYWKYFIHNERIIGPLLKRSTTNARMMSNLVERDVLKQFLPVPSSIEQSSIGHMLHLIDNLIAANEDKLNQLKKLKKYLMQNMFV
ncbi:restriction endonuclease subunit S [Lactiplantibacillus plantarum]|uniref:restriction endonuclease subunit S n=1 Tax=Lactiplantibacillus plantarum TaxID=1590 RepID=UPI000FFE2BFC|nr:restriction endonuclease subunit S [Lactiplantibacillus plantarum]QAT33821.1 restriction endonuclease subunit S [Lactiplantibacillus plantarum]